MKDWEEKYRKILVEELHISKFDALLAVSYLHKMLENDNGNYNINNEN